MALVPASCEGFLDTLCRLVCYSGPRAGRQEPGSSGRVRACLGLDPEAWGAPRMHGTPANAWNRRFRVAALGSCMAFVIEVVLSL